jgi:bacillithiol system protein YtxJ
MEITMSSETNFKPVNDAEELNRLFELSNEKPVVLFKHSTMCNVSADAYQQMQNFDGEVNIVIVQTARPVSNEIEARTGVEHKSPQVIILRDGKAVWHTSHWNITAQAVTEAFKAN